MSKVFQAAVLAILSAPALQPQISPGAIGSVAGNGVPGSADGQVNALAGSIDASYAVAVDFLGNVYVADSWNNCIRKVSPQGVMTTFAGTGEEGDSGDGGPATAARLFCPRGVAVDVHGNVFISDTGNSRIRRVTSDGTISTVAGTGSAAFGGDGALATSADLRWPRGIAVGSGGVLYVADTWNCRIRKISEDGTISTIAGTGECALAGDGGPAGQAQVGLVQALTLDDYGSVFFSDALNDVVRVVKTDGTVARIAGTGTPGYSGDGGGGPAATLHYPRGIALDAIGNLYIADSFNHRIRRVVPSSAISTVAGTGEAGFDGDPGPAASAKMNSPYGLGVDFRGNVFVTDMENYRIRKVRLESVTEKPIVGSGSVVNAAGYGTPVAPGSLITIFGQNFNFKEQKASRTPLDNVIGGTSATANGKLMPLLYVGPNQINAQLPSDTATGQALIKTNFGGTESESSTVSVASAAPGIFVIRNQDGAKNDSGHPAAAGSTIVIYGTGAGEVSPPPPDGTPAPSNPLALTAEDPTVTIGNSSAKVQFSGLTQGLVGLWQINAAIPSEAAGGSAVPVVVSKAGITSSPIPIAITPAPPPLPGQPLEPGIAANFALPAVSVTTLFYGDYSYRVTVPAGARSLSVTLQNRTPGIQLALYLRFNTDIGYSSPNVIADYYAGIGTGPINITVTPFTNPPLSTGVYYIAFGLDTLGKAADLSVIAVVR